MYWLLLRFRSRRGIFYTNQEYHVSIKDINVDDRFKEQKISERRFRREDNYWHNVGLYETRVLVDRKFNLVDGYITLLIAEHNGETKIPVNFVNRNGWESTYENR